MFKIERNHKFYAFNKQGGEISINIEMATPFELEGISGYESIATIDSAVMSEKATARLFIYSNPKNSAQLKIKLLGYLSAPCYTDEDEPREYWETLFDSVDFRTSKRSAYSLNLIEKIKAIEASIASAEAQRDEHLKKAEARIAEIKDVATDDTKLIEYATRYGFFEGDSKTFLKPENFSRKSDYAFMYIPMYGVHVFNLQEAQFFSIKDEDKSSDFVFRTYHGKNKFTSELVIVNCAYREKDDNLVLMNVELHEDNSCSHWYQDCEDSGGFTYHQRMVQTAREAVLNSITRELSFHKRDLSNKKETYKLKIEGLKAALSALKQSKSAFDSVLRSEG